jgi:hypothetical protein
MISSTFARTASLVFAVIYAFGCNDRRVGEEQCVARTQPGLTRASAQPAIALSENQRAAIAAIELQSGGLQCTGTLISDRWVLSAKHCALHASEPLMLRTTVATGMVRLPFVSAVAHPTLDVLLLEIPPTDALFAGHITPLDVLRDEVITPGDDLTLSGYGDTEAGTDGTLLFLEESVVEADETTITVDGGAHQGACYGDSGGPLLGVNAHGAVGVVGVLHGGSSSCVGRDRYVRMRSLVEWIDGVEAARPENPCGGLSWEGVCAGGSAIWCEASHVASVICADNEVCGWHAGLAGFRCVDATLDPCRGLGKMGLCEGDLLRTCERGALLTTDCRSCDQACTQGAQKAHCGTAP